MTQDEIIEMYLQVSKKLCNDTEWCWSGVGEPLQMFAKLVAAKAIAELESQESNPIKDGWKLSVADGHSGYGVYAHMDDYPEEGAFLLFLIAELDAQRTWVGLTRIGLIKCGVLPYGRSYELYQAIEAKLKEKNT